MDVEVCLAVRASMMIYAGRRGILGCKQGIYGRVSAGFAVSLEDLFLEVGYNSTNLDSLKTFDKDRLILVGPAKLSAKTCWVFIRSDRISIYSKNVRMYVCMYVCMDPKPPI